MLAASRPPSKTPRRSVLDAIRAGHVTHADIATYCGLHWSEVREALLAAENAGRISATLSARCDRHYPGSTHYSLTSSGGV